MICMTTTKEHTMTTVLSSRETAKLDMLARIADANDAGSTPSKADMTRGLPSKTRAAHYTMIDVLIRRGLVASPTGGQSYALTVTEAGRAELEAHQ